MKDVVDGLTILMKYDPNGGAEAQHDILFATPKITKDAVSDEDAKTLDDLGWHWSDEFDCWARFT